MEGVLFFKFLLAVAFIPATFGILFVARRSLPPRNSFRRFLEQHGVEKIALYLLLATYALGGTWLTLTFS